MMSNAARKFTIGPRRVNRHAVRSHAPEWRYPRPSRREQWMIDWGCPLLILAAWAGLFALVLGAISGALDKYLDPVFKSLGI